VSFNFSLDLLFAKILSLTVSISSGFLPNPPFIIHLANGTISRINDVASSLPFI
jgi:hypothetical protein